MTTAYIGHIVAVEADADGGRYWRTFDATKPDTRVAVSAQVGQYIARLADDGELSDVDCAVACPCVTPVDGCEQCEAVGTTCRECWADMAGAR